MPYLQTNKIQPPDHGEYRALPLAKRMLLTGLCFVLLAVSLSGCAATEARPVPYAQNGRLDLAGLLFYELGNIRLDGEWAFYWNRFLDPQDTAAVPDAYIRVPSVWNGSVIDGEPVSGTGHATYRLHVKTTLPQGTLLGLSIPTISSAYRLYVGEALVARGGTPSADVQSETGKYLPQEVYFPIPDSEFTITVHVSNHIYARGGLWGSLLLGTVQGINARYTASVFREAAFSGALALIMLLYGTLVVMRREFLYLLCFTGLCLSTILSIDTISHFFIVRIWPQLPLHLVILLWYSAGIWLFFFLYLFIHMLYVTKASRTMLKVFLVLALAQQAAYLCTPVSFYSRYLSNFYTLVNVAQAACAMYVIVAGFRSKRPDSLPNLVSILVALLCYIHDDFYWRNLLHHNIGELYPVGLLVFLVLQIILQAKRIRRDYQKQAAAELAFWQAQIKPHFLYNAFNTFISVSYYDIGKARELMQRFAGFLRLNFDFKNASTLSTLAKETELAKAYAQIEEARFEEHVRVRFNVCQNTHAMVPVLVLQPVIENAINHGLLPKADGGTVEVDIVQEGKSLLFRVRDDGVGMEQAQVARIFSEENSGIGLYNINKRLKALYGKGLAITSAPGAGTTICWSVPLHTKEKPRK